MTKKRNTPQRIVSKSTDKPFVSSKNEVIDKTMTGTTFSVNAAIAEKHNIDPNILVAPMVASQAIMDDLEYQLKLQEKKGK